MKTPFSPYKIYLNRTRALQIPSGQCSCRGAARRNSTVCPSRRLGGEQGGMGWRRGWCWARNHLLPLLLSFCSPIAVVSLLAVPKLRWLSPVCAKSLFLWRALVPAVEELSVWSWRPLFPLPCCGVSGGPFVALLRALSAPERWRRSFSIQMASL